MAQCVYVWFFSFQCHLFWQIICPYFSRFIFSWILSFMFFSPNLCLAFAYLFSTKFKLSVLHFLTVSLLHCLRFCHVISGWLCFWNFRFFVLNFSNFGVASFFMYFRITLIYFWRPFSVFTVSNYCALLYQHLNHQSRND